MSIPLPRNAMFYHLPQGQLMCNRVYSAAIPLTTQKPASARSVQILEHTFCAYNDGKRVPTIDK